MASRNLSASLTCAICLQLFEDPKNMPTCSHTFCFGCIQRLSTISTGTSTAIQCPTCRKLNVLGKDGVEGLRTNRAVKGAIEIIQAPAVERAAITSTSSSSPAPSSTATFLAKIQFASATGLTVSRTKRLFAVANGQSKVTFVDCSGTIVGVELKIADVVRVTFNEGGDILGYAAYSCKPQCLSFMHFEVTLGMCNMSNIANRPIMKSPVLSREEEQITGVVLVDDWNCMFATTASGRLKALSSVTDDEKPLVCDLGDCFHHSDVFLHGYLDVSGNCCRLVLWYEGHIFILKVQRIPRNKLKKFKISEPAIHLKLPRNVRGGILVYVMNGQRKFAGLDKSSRILFFTVDAKEDKIVETSGRSCHIPKIKSAVSVAVIPADDDNENGEGISTTSFTVAVVTIRGSLKMFRIVASWK